ncbi:MULTISPECIES: hypothetical protein [Halorussus]|uniref:hypothetical protein n=1 Tax=Halorussus TaxID=1070314 RepID=UPI0020A0D2E9|nr:hypothetical protein [Halorussus vallis]USZ74057.1 hypothetical protein NGM07_11380 [Halorussus vallis]
MKCEFCPNEVEPHNEEDALTLRIERDIVVEDTVSIIPDHVFDHGRECISHPADDEDRDITKYWSSSDEAVFCSDKCLMAWVMLQDSILDSSLRDELRGDER